MTLVTRRFADAFTRRDFCVIILGRASVLRCTSPDGAHLDLVNLHLTHTAQAGDPVRQLHRVRLFVRSRARASTVIAGDVNFVDAVEGRLNIASGRSEFSDEPAAAAFSRLFPEFAEVIPQGYTRAQTRIEDGGRRVALLARIDRCWATLPTPFLCARSARCAILDPVTSADRLSDHAPIALRWEAAPRERLRRIPDWVARRPEFAEKVAAIASETVGYGSGDLWERLDSHIALMHLAASEVVMDLRRPAPAETGAWRFHWLTALVRAVRRLDGRAAAQALLRIPDDADLVHIVGGHYRVRDEGELADRMHSAATEAMLVERRRDVRAAPSEEAKRAARARWARRLSAWSPKSRALKTYAIADADGHAVWDVRLGAEAIAAHWGPAFLQSSRVRESSRTPFANHISRSDSPIQSMSLEEFKQYATRAPRSSPGPDGIPYACWAHGGEGGVRLLHEIYLDMTRGEPVPASFNRAWLVLIPKTSVGPEAANVVSPANLRPLALSNSCQKIVMKALAAPLESMARSLVHEAQRGFVRGRQMSSNLVGADCAIEEFLFDSGADLGLILLDIAAAFPSIDWGWVRWVLRVMCTPEWLLAAILLPTTAPRLNSFFMGSALEFYFGSPEVSNRDVRHRGVFGR